MPEARNGGGDSPARPRRGPAGTGPNGDVGVSPIGTGGEFLTTYHRDVSWNLSG
ncbi:hypothetical protein DVS28_a5087 [Euzebya pacifica]|uniref:Uncharacterized protein n=1 Tax=Euzebya pacifica TaxID=1608957 RepID=A0A346Y5J6_9ACTN|nr:hypothetical protein DVS28_a5087 [Euzebya pacifica]